MGSAAAVAARPSVCCRHGYRKHHDTKKHQCCNKTLPKGERGDYADDAVQRPQHNHNCPGHNGPGVMAGIPTIRKRMKSFPFMVAKHLLSLVDSA